MLYKCLIIIIIIITDGGNVKVTVHEIMTIQVWLLILFVFCFFTQYNRFFWSFHNVYFVSPACVWTHVSFLPSLNRSQHRLCLFTCYRVSNVQCLYLVFLVSVRNVRPLTICLLLYHRSIWLVKCLQQLILFSQQQALF